MDDEEQRAFATAEDFADWIEQRGTAPEGVWMRIPRAGSGIEGIGYAEALQVALAHGWIDGQKRKSDTAAVWLQRFTPRRARSIWSKVNRDHAERLIGEGRMTPRGLAEVERAKADGRWDAAYSLPSTARCPTTSPLRSTAFPERASSSTASTPRTATPSCTASRR